MVWAQPAAALALVAMVIPLLLHLLTRRRARSIQFPTLRFIPSARLAALKRRALDDGALLLIRAAIIAAAAIAAAGPLLVTAARQRIWDGRTFQRTISDARELPGAVAWMRDQPPGRREIVIRSAFPLGSITDADLASVPPEIGLRFERAGTLPSSRVAPAAAALTLSADRSHAAEAVEREVFVSRDRTSVRDIRRSEATIPVEIVAPAAERAAADALLDAILRDRVPAPVPGRLARIELGSARSAKASAERPLAERPSAERPVRDPWMGDAAARIIREAKSHVATADVRAGSIDGRLVIATPAHAGDEGVRPLVRSVFDALAPAFPTDAEVLAISDRQLAAWSRPPSSAPRPSPESIGAGDRRWVWLIALALLATESAIRRRRSASMPDASALEESRVA